ncbi:U-box domain-containing protein 26 [Canna indica]|uniref:Protein TIFY n=1 Tax=Canna indica TaxID=4628 RepID=A0AAQ3JWZ0_9LILI|nr:U-box domain-containing protein 26 [Canna indica]
MEPRCFFPSAHVGDQLQRAKAGGRIQAKRVLRAVPPSAMERDFLSAMAKEQILQEDSAVSGGSVPHQVSLSTNFPAMLPSMPTSTARRSTKTEGNCRSKHKPFLPPQVNFSVQQPFFPPVCWANCSWPSAERFGGRTPVTSAVDSSSAQASIIPREQSRLTLFYGGLVLVYEDVSFDKVEEIMLLARGNTLNATSKSKVPHALERSSESLNLSTGKSGNNISDEMEASVIPRAIPQARKASLARFLEKRKASVAFASRVFALRQLRSLARELEKNKAVMFANETLSALVEIAFEGGEWTFSIVDHQPATEVVAVLSVRRLWEMVNNHPSTKARINATASGDRSGDGSSTVCGDLGDNRRNEGSDGRPGGTRAGAAEKYAGNTGGDPSSVSVVPIAKDNRGRTMAARVVELASSDVERALATVELLCRVDKGGGGGSAMGRRGSGGGSSGEDHGEEGVRESGEARGWQV